MARLILFGGGDAGGILITSNGVKPIPPFDPRLRARLHGLSLVLRGSASLGGNWQRELEAVTTKASHALVNDLQDVGGVGSLEGESTVVAMWSDGDGFTCGSTGKPIPFPPPKGGGPHVDPRVADASMAERVTIRN